MRKMHSLLLRLLLVVGAGVPRVMCCHERQHLKFVRWMQYQQLLNGVQELQPLPPYCKNQHEYTWN